LTRKKSKTDNLAIVNTACYEARNVVLEAFYEDENMRKTESKKKPGTKSRVFLFISQLALAGCGAGGLKWRPDTS
jgi:hypothetical protein